MKLKDCPVSRTLHFFDGKWKPLILNELKTEPLRASELARRIPEVTPKVLTQQLRELERDGVISRLVLPRVPPHVEYKLSPFGLTLKPVLNALCKWGEALASGQNTAGAASNRQASHPKH
jgi:DNA-binding HxlR family transcriptional regulator